MLATVLAVLSLARKATRGVRASSAMLGVQASLAVLPSTTALPWPFDVLVAKGEIFGTPLYEYLDAGQTAAKSYAAFLLEVPKDYRGVHDIDYADGRITIRERLVLYELAAKPDRDLVMEVGDLFQ